MTYSGFQQQPFSFLSLREREVMLGIVEGMSNKYISSEMQVSQRTVEAHRARIFDKTKVRNAVELTRLWMGHTGTKGPPLPVYRFCKRDNACGAIGPSGMQACANKQCSTSYRCVLDQVARNGSLQADVKADSSVLVGS